MVGIGLRSANGRIIVEPISDDEKNKWNILIPEKNNANTRGNKGIVIAVGECEDGKNMNINVGDTVIFGNYCGTNFKHNGKDYISIKETDVCAVVTA